LNLVNRWQAYNLATAGVDYLDCHAYYQYSFQDFYQTVTNLWGLPVVFGETGISMSGVWSSGPDNETTHPYSSEKRQDFFFAAQAAAELPYFQLAGIWAIAPNWLTNEEDFGLYSGTQNASYQLTQGRDQLRNFAMFPTNVQPANYSWSICCTGVNTAAAGYTGPTRYAVQNGMLDVSVISGSSAPMWQRQNNLIQNLGNTSSLAYADCQGVLWQTTLPNTTGQAIQFDIPPQSPALYLSEYATWECVARGQASGNSYIVSLTHDTGGTYDNKLEVFSYVGGVKTSLTNITYGSALDLTKWWRVTANVSTNTYPTTLTCTVSNMTSGILMSPALVCVDSAVSLQSPGGMGLCGYLGQPCYTNILFTAKFDPVAALPAAPAGTSVGATVSLTWSAAVGGSGTINYTPQYDVSDSFGFPSTTVWTNGSQTTGTGEMLNSLPANTNLIFRVMSVDAMNATNYSPWLMVAMGSPSPSTNTYLLFHY
jgi:hypothetical protein